MTRDDASDADDRQRFTEIILADPLCREALERARRAALAQWRIVAGVLYNAVWNHLTGRPSGHGVNDIDLIYFDDADLSWEAEDEVIKTATPLFADLPKPVEIRNQARVHLWYQGRFGKPYAPLSCVDDAPLRYTTVAHAVAARLEPDGRVDLYAPFGLRDVFEMRLRPNRAFEDLPAHRRKAARAKSMWPELTVDPG